MNSGRFLGKMSGGSDHKTNIEQRSLCYGTFNKIEAGGPATAGPRDFFGSGVAQQPGHRAKYLEKYL